MRTRRHGGRTWFTRNFYSKERQLTNALEDLENKFKNINKVLRSDKRDKEDLLKYLKFKRISRRFAMFGVVLTQKPIHKLDAQHFRVEPNEKNSDDDDDYVTAAL